MANTDSQTELLRFGPVGKPTLTYKEQVTPHKISLLILIYEYCELKKKQNQPFIFGQSTLVPEERISENEKRDFMTLILKLLQSPDLSLKDLLDQTQHILKPKIFDEFMDRLKEFYEEDVLPLMDFFQELHRMLTEPITPEMPVISGSSVLGLFFRRMILVFDSLSFSQVTTLYNQFRRYYEEVNAPPQIDESENFGGSLMDSITKETERLTCSALGRESSHLGLGQTKSESGGYFSHKQAEYFISRQGFLLQHNEKEAMSPKELQTQISNMLRSNPALAEAHFLSYMNNLRVKEYCNALHNLFHCFDRNTNFTDDIITNKTVEEDVSRRYASLNLAGLHFRFGHKEEALAALQEAIRMAQETNDHVCLQHALSWLHRIEDSGNARTASLIARSVEKSEELALPNITSLSVQALAKHNAFSTARPSSVIEYMLKSDILNCQHSQPHFMCVSYAQKAALWHMYGKRESSSMCSQLVLNLDTSEGGIYHNGESVCLALCNLARIFADDGNYLLALEVINNAKQRFPRQTQHAHLWMTYEQEIVFDRSMISHRDELASQALTGLQALDEDEYSLRSGIFKKEKGDVSASLATLTKLRERVQTNSHKFSPEFPCRVMLALADLYIQTGNHISATPQILECITKAKEHYLDYMHSLAAVYLAFVQLLMQLPEKALELLDQHMVTILSHGNCLDRARTMYCYARCSVAAGSKLNETDRKSSLLLAVNLMISVIELFKKLEAHMRVKDAVYYLARLYHELGYTSERNKCAYEFNQLDSQYPTHSQVSVLRL
ncbi:anaphase-promoting complex subunit 5-like [Saccostrea echinata]|uniref:anaphase-promoting complex subunit 5-like n=1 Tax=Saccostrea echinata TaxID=191078 RepID=UPI002A7F4503|nr:anaphase-promoting complex subunit 5-like [Saccostrea echinata]